jgi:hypothetical protein
MTTLDDIPIEEPSNIAIRPAQLNLLLKSILVPSQITLIHGQLRSPMTILSHEIAIGSIRSGKNTMYLDSGTNFKPTLARKIAGEEYAKDLKNLIVANIMGLDDVEDIVTSVASKYPIIIIDSLTGALNLNLPPGSKKRQQRLFSTLETLRESIMETSSHLIITDHSSRDPITGESRPVGGNVLQHSIDSMVRISSFENRGETYQIKIERSPNIQTPESLLVRMGDFGIRPLRRF